MGEHHGSGDAFMANLDSRCRSGASCDCFSATVCGFPRSPVAAIPASPAVESRHQARVRVTTPQVDTSVAVR
jgi:hypothetical protein